MIYPLQDRRKYIVATSPQSFVWLSRQPLIFRVLPHPEKVVSPASAQAVHAIA
jgi:hypothetical protein